MENSAELVLSPIEALISLRNEMKGTSRFEPIILIVIPYMKAGTDILVPRRRKIVDKSTKSGRCLQQFTSQMHFPCDSTLWWVPGSHSAAIPSHASSLRVDQSQELHGPVGRHTISYLLNRLVTMCQKKFGYSCHSIFNEQNLLAFRRTSVAEK